MTCGQLTSPQKCHKPSLSDVHGEITISDMDQSQARTPKCSAIKKFLLRWRPSFNHGRACEDNPAAQQWCQACDRNNMSELASLSDRISSTIFEVGGSFSSSVARNHISLPPSGESETWPPDHEALKGLATGSSNTTKSSPPEGNNHAGTIKIWVYRWTTDKDCPSRARTNVAEKSRKEPARICSSGALARTRHPKLTLGCFVLHHLHFISGATLEMKRSRKRLRNNDFAGVYKSSTLSGSGGGGATRVVVGKE